MFLVKGSCLSWQKEFRDETGKLRNQSENLSDSTLLKREQAVSGE